MRDRRVLVLQPLPGRVLWLCRGFQGFAKSAHPWLSSAHPFGVEEQLQLRPSLTRLGAHLSRRWGAVIMIRIKSRDKSPHSKRAVIVRLYLTKAETEATRTSNCTRCRPWTGRICTCY